MIKMKVIISILLITFLFGLSLGSTEDEIQSLPGLAKKPSFRQYSGYLKGGEDLYLHYWFVESQGNPEKDPVVLWLNGGPGCSSMLGFLKENGPFKVSGDGQTLTPNPHSWNTLANVLYLESPVGVGFSYETKDVFDNSDDTTAKINYRALQDFFKKFPQFSSHDFYITGESYGGVYVPTLAVEVYRNNASSNLKGVAIGNGLLDYDLLTESGVELLLSHGLVDIESHTNLLDKCCKLDTKGRQKCDYKSKTCPIADYLNSFIESGLDIYNVLKDCMDELEYYSLANTVQVLYGLEQPYRPMAESNPNCQHHNVTGYLNRPDVQQALHVAGHGEPWTSCNLDLNKKWKRQHMNMTNEFRELIEVHKVPKFIVYHGDLDMACDFLGNQQFVDNLGYKVTEKYKPWKVNGRVGGFVKRYEGLTYTVVRGAGHLVPEDQPEAGLEIFKELIGKTKLT